MSEQRRSYLLKVSEPYVMVPARVAALLETRSDVSALRVQVRGVDPEASAVLEDIRLAALEWRSSATGTTEDTQPELAPRSKWQSTTEAGEVLGISGRAVVKAINDDRLPAEQVAGRWRIRTEDIHHFKAQRQGARP